MGCSEKQNNDSKGHAYKYDNNLVTLSYNFVNDDSRFTLYQELFFKNAKMTGVHTSGFINFNLRLFHWSWTSEFQKKKSEEASEAILVKDYTKVPNIDISVIRTPYYQSIEETEPTASTSVFAYTHARVIFPYSRKKV